MKEKYISERQASILLDVPEINLKIWLDEGYFDDFKIVKDNMVFFIKEDILKWFTQYLEKKAEGNSVLYSFYLWLYKNP